MRRGLGQSGVLRLLKYVYDFRLFLQRSILLSFWFLNVILVSLPGFNLNGLTPFFRRYLTHYY